MKKLYLPLLLLFCTMRMFAQTCTGLNVSYSVAESRCMATGSITATVSGGSGNYNYKAIGPVTTPYTVANVITGLQAGYYKLVIQDLVNNCTKTIDSVYVPGTYNDPRFQLTKSNVSCAGNDGTISAVNLQYGRGPFTYSIIAPSPAGVGNVSPTGNFTGLIPGEYYVQLRDSCGGIQVRRISIENYYWWIDAVTVSRLGCDSAIVSIRLKDNYGNTSNGSSAFAGYTYGIVKAPGDTSWYNSSPFHIYLGNKHHLTIVVKDNCGNVNTYEWYFPPSQQPYVGTIFYSDQTCTSFSATVWNVVNMTNPTYCLYNSGGALVNCDPQGVFTNIPYGSYCIKVRDACYDTTITNCFTVPKPVPSVDSLVDRYDFTCTTFTANISGQNNLINPQYCIYNSGGTQLSCNTTGEFTNLPYGSYCIKVKNGCNDTSITRCFTVTRPRPILTYVNLYGYSCTKFNVEVTGDSLINPIFCLYDSAGVIITCDSTGVFTGLNYGHYCIKSITACGDTSNAICFTGSAPRPSLGSVVTSNAVCTGFTATVTGQTNVTNPQYCLYNAADSLLLCNTTGIFTNLAYGSYCIKMHDGCIDTVITRCFSKTRPLPTINGTIGISNANCTTFTATVSGSNLTSPNYCLTDSLGTITTCNTTGVFNNIPFGYYCATIQDGCTDTTMKLCRSFRPNRGININANKSCAIGFTDVAISFANTTGPYTVAVYAPNGTVVATDTANTAPLHVQLGALPAGQQYTIVGKDGCGQTDTVRLTPDVTKVTRSSAVAPKCPTGVFLNGAGDLQVTCSSNLYTLTPLIIKKNTSLFVRNFSYQSGNTYIFSDLEPASYIVEYTLQNCNTKFYDTLIVPPYTYPTQGQSVLYQCDNQGFSLGADVSGGISPYSYQIIGSVPSSPSIVTGTQSSPLFNINTGTTYSLVRLRTVDACGNATLSDVSVLPLQNFSVTATSTCYFQNITLSVDNIPNATYYWYRKTTPTDSVLLDSGYAYSMANFQPGQSGRYICKIVVHNGCTVRQAYIDLYGCIGGTLPVNVQLNGKVAHPNNELSWYLTDDEAMRNYVIERKSGAETEYVPIGAVPAKQSANSNTYTYTDKNVMPGNNQYRIKILDYQGRAGYTNTVNLKNGIHPVINVYPNPVKQLLQISIASEVKSNYEIVIMNAGGQKIYTREIKNISNTVFNYSRTAQQKPGVYVVRVTNLGNGSSSLYKIVFE